jgi:hypothetical protein
MAETLVAGARAARNQLESALGVSVDFQRGLIQIRALNVMKFGNPVDIIRCDADHQVTGANLDQGQPLARTQRNDMHQLQWAVATADGAFPTFQDIRGCGGGTEDEHQGNGEGDPRHGVVSRFGVVCKCGQGVNLKHDRGAEGGTEASGCEMKVHSWVTWSGLHRNFGTLPPSRASIERRFEPVGYPQLIDPGHFRPRANGRE